MLFCGLFFTAGNKRQLDVPFGEKTLVQYAYFIQVKSKDTTIRLIDIKSILITYIDCFYYSHKICICRIAQSWPTKSSQLFITRFEIKNSRPGNKIQFLSKNYTKKV